MVWICWCELFGKVTTNSFVPLRARKKYIVNSAGSACYSWFLLLLRNHSFNLWLLFYTIFLLCSRTTEHLLCWTSRVLQQLCQYKHKLDMQYIIQVHRLDLHYTVHYTGTQAGYTVHYTGTQAGYSVHSPVHRLDIQYIHQNIGWIYSTFTSKQAGYTVHSPVYRLDIQYIHQYTGWIYGVYIQRCGSRIYSTYK